MMKGLYLDNGGIAAGAFDFDGNILQAPTTHFYENIARGRMEEIPAHEVDQNPERFFGETAEYKFIEDNPENSFRNFRCVSPYSERGFDGLILDVEQALANEDFSPSFKDFKEVFLIKGRIWSLITARGNSPDNFQKAFEIINRNSLTQEEQEEQLENIRKNYALETGFSDIEVLQYYFRNFVVDFICCNNTHQQRHMGLHSPRGGERKAAAMDWWIPEIERKLTEIGKKVGKNIDEIITQETPLSLGFSDDSVGNITAMNDYFSEKIPKLGQKYRARVFYTGPRKGIGEITQKVNGISQTKQNPESFEIRFQ